MTNLQYWQKKASNLTYRTQAFINGAFVDARGGGLLKSINPATEAEIAEVANCADADVDDAVKAARKSYIAGDWSRLSAKERKSTLLKLASLIEKHSEELALIDSMDMGKPISESFSFDLPSTVDIFQWTAEAIDKLYGEIAPTSDDSLALISREPVGVVAAIVPWNYPLLMAAWKIAPALAAGNSVILKPSEKSPLSALRLAELAYEAGIPKGVFNVLPGYGHIAGKALALHMDVDVLAFTGSTQVGKMLLQYAGQSNMKQVWVETGGKSPNIVFADCPNLKNAAEASAYAILHNQGEACIAASRLYLEKSIISEFMPELIKAIKGYVPGDPLDPKTTLGPLVDKNHFEAVKAYVESGKKDGARLLTGDENADLPKTGYFMNPAVFDHTHSNMKIVQEEIFGPVLAIDSFETWEEAIQKANDSIYGLGASIWTSNLTKAHRTSRELQAGMVWVNNWAGSDSSMPFGGIKQSGNGRDKSLYALQKYSNLKTIWISLDDKI